MPYSNQIREITSAPFSDLPSNISIMLQIEHKETEVISREVLGKMPPPPPPNNLCKICTIRFSNRKRFF